MLGQVGIPRSQAAGAGVPPSALGRDAPAGHDRHGSLHQPGVLIADEPTTALDVTIQAQILELMKALRERNRMAIMLITHDLGVIAEMADDVVVMYAGKIVEAPT